MAVLLSLVLSISAQYNVPSYLVVAIVECESNWNPHAIHINKDGTVDQGIMQLNSSWWQDDLWYEPFINIHAGVQHLVALRELTDSWYQATIAYNCGIARIKNPPSSSLDYAVKVFEVWEQYNKRQLMAYAGR
jgi:soluble lytic murein transglycosylase-like protein